MSHIDDMIERLCPNGVEFKALGEVAAYSDTRISARTLDGDSFVGVDNLVANKGGKVRATYRPNSGTLTAYEPGDLLLGNIRPYLKKVWLADAPGGCSGDVLAVRIAPEYQKHLGARFLYYLASSNGQCAVTGHDGRCCHHY